MGGGGGGCRFIAKALILTLAAEREVGMGGGLGGGVASVPATSQLSLAALHTHMRTYIAETYADPLTRQMCAPLLSGRSPHDMLGLSCATLGLQVERGFAL